MPYIIQEKTDSAVVDERDGARPSPTNDGENKPEGE